MPRSTVRPPPFLLVAGSSLCALLAGVLALWWAGNFLEWVITGR